jgi:hypothetical protein
LTRPLCDRIHPLEFGKRIRQQSLPKEFIKKFINESKIMHTLEQRVERLERSCRRWRIGFLVAVVAAVAVGASKPGSPPDAEFGNVTVQSLKVRTAVDGALLWMTCDKDQASIKMASPASATSVALIAQKDSANVFVSRNTGKAFTTATLSADDQSGFVDVRNAAGKDKEIEPE